MVPLDGSEHSMRALEKAVQIAKKFDGKAERVQVETLLKEGHTAEEILRTARAGKFDLIVMGARDLSKIKEVFLGSVSHEVARQAPCPVLVVK